MSYTEDDMQAAVRALAQPRMHVNTSRGRQESDARLVLDTVAPAISARAKAEMLRDMADDLSDVLTGAQVKRLRDAADKIEANLYKEGK